MRLPRRSALVSAAVEEQCSEPTSLVEIIRTSTKELLDAYGVSSRLVEYTGTPATEFALAFAAVIGFTGEALRGTLLITTTITTLERSNPVPGSPVREWIAELANQLLGRIKNQLLSCDVEINLTTPLVLRGQHLSVESLRDSRPIEMETDGGPIFVWLENEGIEGLVLVRRPKLNAKVEGDSFLF